MEAIMSAQPTTPDQQPRPPIEIEIIAAPSRSQQRLRVALVPAHTKPTRCIHLAHGEYTIEPRPEPKA